MKENESVTRCINQLADSESKVHGVKTGFGICFSSPNSDLQ